MIFNKSFAISIFCLSLLFSVNAHANECKSFFSEYAFKKLTLKSFYLFDDHSAPESTVTGELTLFVENKNRTMSVTTVNHEKWLPKNPSLLKPQVFEFTEIHTVPVGTAIRFPNPAKPYVICNCSFYFTPDHAFEDQIQCNSEYPVD